MLLPQVFFFISFLCFQNSRLYQFFEPYFKKLLVGTLLVFFIFRKVISYELLVRRILNFLLVYILLVFEDFFQIYQLILKKNQLCKKLCREPTSWAAASAPGYDLRRAISYERIGKFIKLRSALLGRRKFGVWYQSWEQ